MDHKIVSEQTNREVRKTNGPTACICHITSGKTLLDKILKGDKISLRASRIDTFWKPEEREPDDHQEFQGVMKLIDALNLDIKIENDNGLSSKERNIERDILQWLRERLMNKGIREPKIIGSPTTPYVLCFSTALNNPELLCRFCSKKNGFEVGIILDYDMLCDDKNILEIKHESQNDCMEKGNAICKHTVEKELIQVHYANKPEELFNSNAKFLHCCAIKELKDLDQQLKENDNHYIGSRETDGDYNIDACYFVKRGKYACEKEIRLLLRTSQPSAFYIDMSAENIEFATETIVKENSTTQEVLIYSEKSNSERYLNVVYSINIIKGIVFGPCVSKEMAQDYVAKFSKRVNLNCNKNIMFMLSDGTQIKI